MSHLHSFSPLLAIAGVLAITAPAGAQLAWTESSPATSPQPRYAHAMTRAHPSYHAYLFGGRDADEAFGDTWSWFQGNWSLRATAGPTPRYDHAMTAYHFEDDSLLVFGGRDANGNLLGDTWIWNGSVWNQLATPIAPSPRAGHAMVKDEYELKTVLLFGGRTADGLSDETWRFANGQWTLIPTTTAPSPREGHAFVASNDAFYFQVIGGRDDASTLADEWMFDGKEWTHLGWLFAPQRDAAVVTDDFWRDRPLSFGGIPEGLACIPDSTIERVDSGYWVIHVTEGHPSPRFDSAIALDWVGNHPQYVLFGGIDYDGNVLGDTFTLQPLTLPGTQLVGQGCGPGAWGPNGGPNLFASQPMLGSTIDLQGYTALPSFGAFVVGPEFDPAPVTACSLKVFPSVIVPVPVLELFPGLAIGELHAAIPFLPEFNGIEVPIQLVVVEPTVPGGLSFSQVLRLKLAE